MFEFQGGMTAAWVVLMIIFLVIEGIVPGLVSIWFALGALAALISAMLGAQIWLQATWFVVISLLALVVTRPLAKRKRSTHFAGPGRSPSPERNGPHAALRPRKSSKKAPSP